MNEKRLGRVGHEIQRIVSKILTDGLKDPRIKPMTSVTKVQVTNDLSFANIYISVLGTEEEKQDTLKGLENAKGFIRKTISAEVELRHTPEPKFIIDNSIEDASAMQELIQRVRSEDQAREQPNHE